MKDMKMMKPAKAAVHKHERAMHPGKPLTPMKKGGMVKTSCGMAKGGAVKVRGTGAATKGKMARGPMG
jgi:hypothetical protein